MQAYAEKLRLIGAKVVLIANDSTLSCPLRAQLQRLFAFSLDLVSNSEDVIVTADADSFVMTPEALRGPLSRRRFDGWLFRYTHSIKSGDTLAMDYMAFRKRIWRRIFAGVFAPGELIREYSRFDGLLKANYTWDYDQLISTRAVLRDGLCTLPVGHPLWRRVGLHGDKKVQRDKSDSKCFYGDSEWDGCNEIRRHHQGCLKWHFLPT